MADGGRLQLLDRTAPPAAAPPPRAVAAADGVPAVVAAEAGDEEKVPAGPGREDKLGRLRTMRREGSAADPCPARAASFLAATRLADLVRELSRHVQEPLDAEGTARAAETAPEALPEETASQPPPGAQRQGLAARRTWPPFAPRVAAAAGAWSFPGATRTALVGDGSANPWRWQRRCFGSWVPIWDCLPALSYVYAAATAGRVRAAGWAC